MADTKSEVHNRFKLPFFVICLLCGGLIAADGAVTGRVHVLLIGVLGCLCFGACAWFALALLRRSI